ncbi:MAG TPA: ATP-binding protein [Candidatus Limnocylindrales bacterium]|nr:ATP-binding protein [Candidatus Limnocylindrales bacterium]
MPEETLTEAQLRERGLAGLAELARLDERTGSINAVAARALDLVGSLLDADRAAVCAIDGDETIEWLAHRRMEQFIAASADLRPSDLLWARRPLETGRPELFDRRAPSHERSALSDTADALGMAAFAIVPLRSGQEFTGILGLVWNDDPPELGADEELLTTIGRLVALALGNTRLRDTLLARQAELDESEARYRSLFEQAPEPMLICDWDGAVLDFNRAAMALYGVTGHRLLNHRLETLTDISLDRRRRLAAALHRSRREEVEARGRRRDGSEFPLVLHLAVIAFRGEERLLVQLRDMTDQQRMQAELLQAQKMEALGQLISGVAHELNNPLSAIIAFSQLLRSDERLPADLARDADLLVGEADRTRRIVQNLLDFARQRTPDRQPTSLPALVERTLELHAYALRAGRIETRVLMPTDLPDVWADSAQIQQVLLNLTLNAIQSIRASNPNGTLTIAAHTEPRSDGPRFVRLRVEDDGPGVELRSRDHLFEPFFTTKDVGQGTGLGLSVSYGIVAAHGGKLWYEPASVAGATFLLELPAAADIERTLPGKSGQLATAAANRGLGSTVLVVDDERAIRETIRRALERAGHSVTAAGSGAEALEILRDRSVDLLLIDHRMSAMDGTEFYGYAIAARPELTGRALMMTGDTLNPELLEFVRENSLSLIAKPFDIDDLTAEVDSALAPA